MSERASDDVAAGTHDERTRVDLVAARMRQTASRRRPIADARVPSFALEHAVAGDLGHIHAAHDLTRLPIASRHKLTRPLVVAAKRMLRRGLHPLPEAQSTWNGANARVITFLLRQLAAQARTIESLERQVAHLHDELRQ